MLPLQSVPSGIDLMKPFTVQDVCYVSPQPKSEDRSNALAAESSKKREQIRAWSNASLSDDLVHKRHSLQSRLKNEDTSTPTAIDMIHSAFTNCRRDPSDCLEEGATSLAQSSAVIPYDDLAANDTNGHRALLSDLRAVEDEQTGLSKTNESKHTSIDTEAPALAEQIREAVTRSLRKTFTRGDAAVIIDTKDLSQTLLFSAHGFLAHSLKFPTVLSSSGKAMGRKPETIKRIFAMDWSPAPRMPALVLIEPRTDKELVGNATELDFFSLSSPDSTALEPRSKWSKAYELFFTLLSSSKQSSIKCATDILGESATSALIPIEGLVEIAKHHDVLDDIVVPLRAVLYKYIGNSTLYQAIAEQAPSWLLVSIAIEDEAMFKEAFCHLAGSFPLSPWNVQIDDLPNSIRELIVRYARNLEFQRYQTENKLHRITVKVPATGTSDVKGDEVVSHYKEPNKYDIVNFWSHWIAEHLEYTECRGVSTPKPSPFCDHVGGHCLERAALYRVIYRGGDAYLTVNSVSEKWNKVRHKPDKQEIEAVLTVIKAEASKIVKELARSELNYKKKEHVPYLTCVAIKDEDLPWKDQAEDMEVED